MKTHSDMTPNADLDALFAQAQAHPPEIDAAFMARVLADARALQPLALRRAPVRPGLWARLAAALGGALAVAGLGTAAMAGLVIGYVQPEPMVSLAGSIGFGVSESLDLLPGFDALLIEDALQ
ncbi:MAG: dihydroorotate dehydrogenase [Pseudotabrizicola sp.]|uniref:dihydroorotate dehydrogenase n=1 Tax=Pseudotabrizicola sp. TaxID=2939647 RepID=UPI002730A201|nr:dihydroorotate dehydrogenase [Pseudotabrizicola sp.]MDP2080468.1 dihydroorotate dehydrogenase [Pseudotabrizicola sp.]MDZ7573687.1 dihydroorotate dehydrogenase [Pseudotabrizicola sp.]